MFEMDTPVEREEIYFRHVDYVGYRRTDDLWDIEGRFLVPASTAGEWCARGKRSTK